MTVRVDAAAGVVVDGDDAWPLRLDCRTGDAVLILSGREVAVMPIRWRHKQRLARWAHLGPRFVAEQIAALAVEPGTILADADHAIVVAVAAFLDGDGLPLEPSLLTGVTVEACRATGLAPAALDDRDACEVEMIWRAARPVADASDATPDTTTPVRENAQAPQSAPDPWQDATSIVFEPITSRSIPETRDVDPAPLPTPVPAIATDTVEEVEADTSPATSTHPPEPADAPQRREVSRYRIAPSSPRRPLTGPTAARRGHRLPTPPSEDLVVRPRPVASADIDHAVGGRGPRVAPMVTTTSDGGTMFPVALAGSALAAALDRHRWVSAGSPAADSRNEPGTVFAGEMRGSTPAPADMTLVDDLDNFDDLDALAAAVAERITEQLVVAADDLGIEV